jgi:hypothetical protein
MKKLTNLMVLCLAALPLSLHGGDGCDSSSCCKDVDLLGEDWREHWHLYVREGDPAGTYSVSNGILGISGVPHGYIRTKKAYQGMRLSLEWRWVEEPGNSGVLVHINGPDKVWPLCIEAQLMNGKAGDIVLMGTGAGIEVDGVSHLLSGDARFGVIPRKAGDFEKPAGEWNHYEIISESTNLTLSINGTVVNSGTGMTLTSGFIGIQSEGKPVEIRNIRVEALDGCQKATASCCAEAVR